MALIAAVIGAGLGYYRQSLVGASYEIFPAIIFVGTAGACSGWISGVRWRPCITLLFGLILGYIVFFYNSYEEMRYLDAVGFGIPIGAISGALLGEFIEDEKKGLKWAFKVIFTLIFIIFIALITYYFRNTNN